MPFNSVASNESQKQLLIRQFFLKRLFVVDFCLPKKNSSKLHLENLRCALLEHNLVFSRFNWVPMVCGAPEKIGSPLQEMNQILIFQR